jgi:hypothetical protein
MRGTTVKLAGLLAVFAIGCGGAGNSSVEGSQSTTAAAADAGTVASTEPDGGTDAGTAQNPPAAVPGDECAGLMPAAAAPIVAQLPHTECLDGHVDGQGNLLLGSLSDDGPSAFPQYLFFDVSSGQAAQLAGQVIGGDESFLNVLGRTAGFAATNQFGVTGRLSLQNYAHDGTPGPVTVLDQGAFGVPQAKVSSVIDPAGGTALLVSVADSTGTYSTTYQRFDNGGVQVTAPVAVPLFGAMGFSSAGHILVVAPANATQSTGLWIDRAGNQLTQPFGPFAGTGTPAILAQADGSVAALFSPGAFRLEDLGTTPAPLPASIVSRAGQSLYAVRGGRAFASWGASGACGAGLEILATSGKSCGCVDVPGLNSESSVGLDGSLIVPLPPQPPVKCQFNLYPALLK